MLIMLLIIKRRIWTRSKCMHECTYACMHDIMMKAGSIVPDWMGMVRVGGRD